MNPQRVVCPNCDALVLAENINIAALMGKCVHCHHVFALPRPELPTAAVSRDVPISRPAGIVQDFGPGGELYIRRSWFHPLLFFLLFFCIAWDGFLIFWYAMALFGKPGGGSFWLMVLFPICHVAVGVGLTYYVVAGFLNKTQILADRHDLHVRHRPVPWWGNRSFEVSDIRGFELDRMPVNNGQATYTVCLHHASGDRVTLLRSLPFRQAEYIAATLADYLAVPYYRNDAIAETSPLAALRDAFTGFTRKHKVVVSGTARRLEEDR